MISTRKDLDELEGTQEHADFMALLQGSIYRTDFDEATQKWNAVKDVSLISQFGFKLSDFPNAKAPDVSALPISALQKSQPMTIQMWQARAALDIKGLLDDADAAVAASNNPAIRQYWQYATTLDEGNDFTKAFAATISLTDKQMHDLFVAASEIKLSAG